MSKIANYKDIPQAAPNQEKVARLSNLLLEAISYHNIFMEDIGWLIEEG
ncbi:MAG: hypothetical protein SFT91_02635 [Rickettsiaceae bacterium]|nr:hypothetical protein [Rickettsiaceae bacterium]